MLIHYSTILALLIMLSSIDAHGFMSVPNAIYKDPETKTTYIYRVDANALYPGVKWNDSPDNNANQLIKKINSKEYPSTREFMDKYISGCPFNDINTPINVDALSTFEWRNDEEHQGFVDSHRGPCELWIDDTLIYSDSNCAAKDRAYPAAIPVDYSICNDKCLLQFYWVTLQEPLWQLYKGCALITKNNNNKSPSMTPQPSTTAPQASPSMAPQPSTMAPQASPSMVPQPSTMAPQASPSMAPQPSTMTPQASSSMVPQIPQVSRMIRIHCVSD